MTGAAAKIPIALVTPRYGPEIGGGAERLAREYAIRLVAKFDVTVLTTCARDYDTWSDHFPAGTSADEGVRVVRFPVTSPRDPAAFAAMSRKVFGPNPTRPGDEDQWIAAQGPDSPELLTHLASEGQRYGAVLFIPYVYATTVRGLPLVRDHAVLVPALHDEPSLRLPVFASVIESARSWVFSTPEERDLGLARFKIDSSRCHLVGTGIDPPSAADPTLFRSQFGQTRPYVVVVGRVDPSKGIENVISHHDRLRRSESSAPDLVFVGPINMHLPSRPWLRATGFIPEDLKHSAITGAVALVGPSPHESLSLVLLEAWSHGVPTVCSSGSRVLVAQSRRANAGVWYRDADEYAECIRTLTGTPALARSLGSNGRRFVECLAWSTRINRLEVAIAQAMLPFP